MGKLYSLKIYYVLDSRIQHNSVHNTDNDKDMTQLAIDFCNMYIDKFICKSKISTSKLLPETILFKASQKVTSEITNKIK